MPVMKDLPFFCKKWGPASPALTVDPNRPGPDLYGCHTASEALRGSPTAQQGPRGPQGAPRVPPEAFGSPQGPQRLGASILDIFGKSRFFDFFGRTPPERLGRCMR